jgi:hypothetical protein
MHLYVYTNMSIESEVAKIEADIRDKCIYMYVDIYTCLYLCVSIYCFQLHIYICICI